MSPSPITTSAAAVSNSTSTVTVAIPNDHPKFQDFMRILAALEPVILLGVSPFIKNERSQAIVLQEHSVAKNLFDALSQL
jgi:hypothetical protein